MEIRYLRESFSSIFGDLYRLTYILKFLGFLASAIFLSAIIFPKKGFDFSDESHYLISADPAQMSDAWGWPYGWNLEKVFEYTNYSIANFRIFGFAILILSTYIFAQSFITLLESIWKEVFLKPTRRMILAILTLSSLFFYAGFLRTPSYNWLNLIGILLALSGVFGVQTLLSTQSSTVYSCLFPLIRICIGEFITFPAKPSSTVFIMIWLLTLTVLRGRLTLGLYLFFLQVASLTTLIVLAININFWPSSILDQTLQVLAMPPFASYHTLQGAIYDLALTPFNILISFLKTSSWVLLYFLIHYMLLTKTNLKNSNVGRYYSVQIRIIGYAIGFSLFLWSGIKPTIFTKSVFWLENKLILNTFITLISFIIFAHLMQWRLRSKAKFSRELLLEMLPMIYVVISLVLGAIMFGFGSSGGISSKLSLAPIFLIAFLLLITLQPGYRSKFYNFELVLIAITVSIMITTIFFGSYFAPYRSSPLNTMTEEVTIGNHNSKIMLDLKSAEQITELRSEAFQAGFKQDTSLVNIVYPSGLGYGYALGGRQSPTIIFLWFGYENSLKQAEYLMSKSEGRFDFGNSWILKSPSESYGNQNEVLEQFLESLMIHSGLIFPKNYSLVFQSPDLELWKPQPK